MDVQNDSVLESEISRRGLFRIGGLGGLALMLASCSSNVNDKPDKDNGKPKRGGSLTWGLEADPATLAPFGVGNTSAVQVKNLIYESLVGWDRNLRVVPALATSWETPDSKSYVFHLRQGVKFHSGKAFTAEDVKYSFDLQKSPPAPGTVTSFYPKIASVEVVDPHTVRFHMSQPDGTLLGYCAWLAYSYIVPKGFYDSVDPRAHTDGTGPFKLDSYVANDHVALVRNDSYWRSGFPYLDKLTMKILTDLESRVVALKAGTIDGATIDSDTSKTLTGTSVQILKGATAAFREIEFTIKGDGKPWDDVRVRQAINFAIDRKKIIENVYGGQAMFSSKIPPSYGSWPIAQDMLESTYEKFDLDKAKSLMKDAGHESGFKVTLQALSTPNDYTQIAEVLKEQLKEINIDVTVQPLEIGTFANLNSSGKFEWQSTGRGMRGDPSGYFTDFDPAGSVYQAWFKGGFANQKMTSLIAQGIAETDQAKRQSIYQQLQQIVLTQFPTLPLVVPTKFEGVTKRVHNMVVSVDDTYRGLAEVWVS